jgi:hypothetical protein
MKEKNINFFYKYKKYKNKYIFIKKYLIGGTKPKEKPVIQVNLQKLLELLQGEIEISPDDLHTKTINDDISYLRFTKSDDLHQMIRLDRLDDSNFMDALRNIERYGLKHIENKNGIDFNQTKCITFEDRTEYLANYKYVHRSSRVLNNFSEDRRSENPKHYSFTISNNGIIYGIINDGIEFGATHIQLARDATEKGIISGEIRLDGNNIIFNFSSSLFGFFNYLDTPRPIIKNADTLYTFEERIKMYKLIIFTKKLIEISNGKVFENYDYTQNILFPENKKPTDKEMREICSDESLIILDTTEMSACGSSKNIKTIGNLEIKSKYEELQKKILSNIKDDSVCRCYK